LIHEFVDPGRYFYQPADKKNQIAYLTRKDASGAWLHGVLVRKGDPFTAFTWLPLREMNEQTYAHHLRESAISLATNMQEGMHVSVLEAMACGCLVVGYSGVGGHEYMVGTGEQQNCILVENGNLPALGTTLEQVLLSQVADRHSYDTIIQQAVRTAHAYQNAADEQRSLQIFFAQFA
jgi:hypothetical protein